MLPVTVVHRRPDHRADSRRRGGGRRHATRDTSRRHGRSRTRDRKQKRSRSESSGSPDDSVGHFHASAGDVIARRYVVVKELGVGTFGRVLRCYDRNYDDHVALKVVRRVKKYTESAMIEADILEDIRRKLKQSDCQICVKMYDHFKFEGHYCMVMPSLGKSLYDVIKMNDFEPFSLAQVQDFARQMLEGLDFLREMKLIHTDLKPENILLLSTDLQAEVRNGKPYHIPRDTRIRIIDFGGATYDDERKGCIINTRQYRGPEVTLEIGWSYPSDMWSAACIIAELYMGELLFATHDNLEHLALMERCLGTFPHRMVSATSLRRSFFLENGAVRWEEDLDRESRHHVREMKTIRELTARHASSGLGELLSAMLQLDPQNRCTPRQALSMPFLASQPQRSRSSRTSRSRSSVVA